MAWSAPPTWSVSQVVTAAQMTVLSDDLKYLHGDSGNVQLGAVDYALDASGATTGSPRNLGVNWGTGAAARFYFGDSLNSIQNNTGGRLILQSYHGMVLSGARANGTARGFITGAGSADPGVLIEGSGSGPALLIDGVISGAQHWEYDGVDGTARTVIADGAGDVLYNITGMYAVRASDNTRSAGQIGAITLSVNTNIYDPGGAGTNVLQFQVAANGSVTVQRTAGALTYKVALWLLWL